MERGTHHPQARRHAHTRHGGQRAGGYAPGPAHERAAKEIREDIRSFLLGKDPRRWADFQFNQGLEINKTYRVMEIALLDLAAKNERREFVELIGGRKRDRNKLYGSAGI